MVQATTGDSCRSGTHRDVAANRDGDTIIALGHSHLEKGGNSAQVPVVHVWRFEAGTPKRLQILTDPLQSAKLLGAT